MSSYIESEHLDGIVESCEKLVEQNRHIISMMEITNGLLRQLVAKPATDRQEQIALEGEVRELQYTNKFRTEAELIVNSLRQKENR